MRKFVLTPLVVLFVLLLAMPLYAADDERLVTLNGDITEIIFGLGLGDKIVAVDASSNYPEQARTLPNVSYQGGLSVEAILAFEPTKVIANTDAGPTQVLDQLRAAGVEVVVMEIGDTIDTPSQNIRAVASLVGAEEQGERMAAEVEAKIAEAADRGRQLPTTPRILFLYLGSARIQFAGGVGATSHAMITAAGAIDAGAEAGFVGYMPLTAEGVVAAQPDVIIVTDRGLAVVGGIDGVLDVPGVALTPAGEAGRIIAFEDLYFIGMGPRTGDALLELVEALERMQ